MFIDQLLQQRVFFSEIYIFGHDILSLRAHTWPSFILLTFHYTILPKNKFKIYVYKIY